MSYRLMGVAASDPAAGSNPSPGTPFPPNRRAAVQIWFPIPRGSAPDVDLLMSVFKDTSSDPAYLAGPSAGSKKGSFREVWKSGAARPARWTSGIRKLKATPSE